MSDPIGLINNFAPLNRPQPSPAPRQSTGDGPSFLSMMQDELAKVNQLQSQADQATQQLLVGDRSDVENVMTAAETANQAFRTLQALRNKLMEAYDEVKQIRV
jgi:flagellar hook-basal body complex protein FliE